MGRDDDFFDDDYWRYMNSGGDSVGGSGFSGGCSDEIFKFILIAIVVIIALIMDASTPKCIKTGCDNEQASGSIYCYLHKPYFGSSSYKSKSSGYSSGASSSTSSSSKSSSSSSTKSSGTSSSGKKKTSSSYSSYDEGYDAVYDDDDYDWDRYYSDDDYADGVDDAMDELDW